MIKNRKNKVVVIANDTATIYTMRKEIIECLFKNGYEVSIICKIDKYYQELVNMGWNIIPVSMERRGTNPLQDIILFFTYWNLIRKEKPDIVLTYNIKPNVYGGIVCSILKIPYLVNVCGLGTPVEYSGSIQKLSCFLYKVGVRKASCVFFQNQENQDFFIQRKMLQGSSRLLPGSGVNLKHYELLPYPKNEKVEFLFVSRLMKEKGIEQYLTAAKSIKERYPQTIFHIIGEYDGDTYKELVERYHNEGIIVYHGHQKDLKPFQEKNCCMIHPTYYPEGMSNVLLEAAASGRPIITTDRSGCKEIVIHGITGYLCKQKDSNDLIKQIENFLSLSWEERRNMGIVGRKKVEKEFDRQIVVNIYMEEIIDLLK